VVKAKLPKGIQKRNRGGKGGKKDRLGRIEDGYISGGGKKVDAFKNDKPQGSRLVDLRGDAKLRRKNEV